MTDLVPTQESRDLFHLGPRQKITFATEVANVLRDVIEKQGLAVKIGPGKPYVISAGWATLGSLLGILPREREVKEDQNSDFEAFVDLVRQSDGVVVGGASALCSRDEKRWASADRYARRSMAITRATGKAYRLSFAWIMTLAGYQPTPAEEMPDEADLQRDSRREPQRKDDDEGYNPANRTHFEWLSKQLRVKTIPEERWDAVNIALKGRPASALDQVLKEVL